VGATILFLFISATKDTEIPDQEGQPYLRAITRNPGDSYELLSPE